MPEFDKDNQPKDEARKPRGKGKRVLMVDAIRAKYRTEESFLEAVLDMAMGSPMSEPPIPPNPQMMALVLQRVEPPHKPVYAPVDLNIADGAAEGTLGFCYYPDPGLSQEPGVIAYRQAMQRYDPEHALNRYSLFGYVFANLLLEGLQQHGPNLNREGLIDTMETIRNWDSGGIMPPVTLTSTDHHAQKAGFICELKDGRFQALNDWIVP